MLWRRPGAGPAADRLGPELDVRGGEDPGGLGQADPVRRRRHRQSDSRSRTRPPGRRARPVPARAVLGPSCSCRAVLFGLPCPNPRGPSCLVPDRRRLRRRRARLFGQLLAARARRFRRVAVAAAPVVGARIRRVAALRCPPLRSFLAQPEPLKWIVGGLNDLRSVPRRRTPGRPPGGPPLIEWTISVVRPQFEQM